MYKFALSFLFLILSAELSFAASVAPVSGFARDFISGKPLPHATITILETKQKLKTDENGQFGPVLYPINHALTLKFEKWGYKTTQSATIINPPQGLTNANNNITFQVPSLITFYLFKTLIGAHFNAGDCHVVTTITAAGKSLDDVIQGEEQASISITPAIKEKPYYFDIFKSGPFKNRTSPFTKNLTTSSKDGGAAFFNVPVSPRPYTITAEKKGKRFTNAQFICHQDAFINISPPHGPMLIQ